jgi:hypothetical protein
MLPAPHDYLRCQTVNKAQEIPMKNPALVFLALFSFFVGSQLFAADPLKGAGREAITAAAQADAKAYFQARARKRSWHLARTALEENTPLP